MLSSFDKKLLQFLRKRVLLKQDLHKNPLINTRDLFKQVYEKYYAKMSLDFKKYFEIRVLTYNTNKVIYKRYVRSQTYQVIHKEVLNELYKNDFCKKCKIKLQYNIDTAKSFVFLVKYFHQYCSDLCRASHLGTRYWDKLKKDKELYESRMSKIRNTMILRYGAPTTLQSSTLKSKVQATNLSRYGGLSPAKSKDVAKKISQALKGKYYV